MSDTKPANIIEYVSALSFEATLERLVTTIEKAGLILFSRIDHQAGAHRAGLEMPPTTVLIYGHPKGGTPVYAGRTLGGAGPCRCACSSVCGTMTVPPSPSIRSGWCSGRRVSRTRSPTGWTGRKTSW